MVGNCNYVHARIQEFLPVGDHARLPENSFDNLYFSPQLISQFYSGLSMVYFKENFQSGSNIFRRGRGGGGGVQHFPGGPTFSRDGGIYMLICIETHKTCDFPVGLDPLSPTSDSAHDVACVLNKIKKRKK